MENEVLDEDRSEDNFKGDFNPLRNRKLWKLLLSSWKNGKARGV